MGTDLEVLGKKRLASASEETRLRVARKGGIAPHHRRGLEAADSDTRTRVAKAGVDVRAQDKEGLRVAGRKGGQAVKAEYGIGFYQTIGEIGGRSVKQRYGIEFYKQIGEKGGGVVKEKHGPKFYSMIGRRGRERGKEERGHSSIEKK